jgi:hypothetical protein
MGRRIRILSIASLFAASGASAVNGNRSDTERKLAAAAEERNMSIDIAAADTPVDRGVTCAAMSSSHATIALPLFLPQLERYPTDFFSNAGIQRMVLCGDLASKGKALGGLAVYASNTFYVSLKHANTNPGHATKAFHHEVFHLIDSMDDVAWSRAGGGYVSEYAKTGPKEDRAETFATMMTTPKNAEKVKAKAALIVDYVESNHPALAKQLKR